MRVRSFLLLAAAVVMTSPAYGQFSGGGFSAFDPSIQARGGFGPAPQLAQTDPKVREALNEALSQEIYGLNQDRQAMLEKVLAADPDNVTANAHLGRVKVDGVWRDAAEIAAEFRQNEQLAEYRSRRERFGTSADGQTKLAQWCERQELEEHARIHWLAVVNLEPENLRARRGAGFRPLKTDGKVRWLAPTESIAAANQVDPIDVARQAAANEYRTQLSQVQRDLRSQDESKRLAAIEELKSLVNSDTAGALEALAIADVDAAAAMIPGLQKADGEEASLVLARIAIDSADEDNKRAAATALRDKPFDEFMPELMDRLIGEAELKVQFARDRQGRLMQHSAFTLETRSERHIGEVDAPFSPAHAWLAKKITTSNQEIRDRNKRVTEALAIITERDYDETPEAWWSWWNKYNEFEAGEKLLVKAESPNDLDLLRPQSQFSPIRSLGRSCECFVAGTPVWTDRGAVSIEDVRIGDRVLSQDEATGELSFQMVLRTTIREPRPLVSVDVGDETITCTGGHPFWVAGEGWIKARDLESGMHVHGVNGSRAVSQVLEASATTTFNLVVDTNANYFVGKRKLLVHDNSPTDNARLLVPGLIQ